MEEELPDDLSQPGMMVVRFQPDVVDQLRAPGPDEREVLLLWQVRPGALNVVVASSGHNEIVLRCQLDRVQVLTTFVELRQEPLFANASLPSRKLLREVITKKGRPVYKWYLTKVEVPSQKVLAPPGRGTWSFVPAARVPQDESEIDIPEMNLASTGLYFIRRLAAEDYERLAATAKSMDGKEIRVGTTCSGTDGCLNVLKATVEVMNKEFQARSFLFLDTYGCLCLSHPAVLCLTRHRWPFESGTASARSWMPGNNSSFGMLM